MLSKHLNGTNEILRSRITVVSRIRKPAVNNDPDLEQ